ncbi:MAG: ATP-binding cassette domain-containing protein [Phycisphaerae bacterium]|nr:ATP-binding cassette domain-containing protein [Phycisphaerae bacterium]
MKSENLIEAEAVRKKFCRRLKRSLWYGLQDVAADLLLRPRVSTALRKDEFWAVDEVSFQLKRGDSLGLVGRNGAGKSTLLKLLTGQRALTSGTIKTRGRIVALTELGLGFDPVLTGRENAYVNAAILGFRRREFDRIIEEVIEFAGLREFIDSPVQTYSSGMRARLGFSVAIHLEPDILMVDEVLAVGDINFRRRCVQQVSRYLGRGGSLVLVSHDPYMIQSICNRVLVLERGKVLLDGPAVDGVNLYFQLGHALAIDAAKQQTEGSADSTAHIPSSGSSSQRPRLEVTRERPVVIDSAEIVPLDGSTLTTGGSAKVILRCRSLTEMDVTWGFIIYTPDLWVAISGCFLDNNRPAVRLGSGETILQCRLNKLPLRSGTYALRAGVRDYNTSAPLALLGFEDGPTFFSVTGEASASNNTAMMIQDLVVMEPQWMEPNDELNFSADLAGR